MFIYQILSCEKRGDRADEFDVRVFHIDRIRVNMIILIWLISLYLIIVFQSVLFFLIIKRGVGQNFLDGLLELPVISPPLLLYVGQAVLHLIVRFFDRAVKPHWEPFNHDFGVSLDQVPALILYFLAAAVQINQNYVVELVSFRGAVSLRGHLELLLSDKEVLENLLVRISLTFECKLFEGLL